MSFPNTINSTAATGDHYANTSNKKYPLGQKLILEDGRIFRYILKSSAAAITGELEQGKGSVSGDVRLPIVTTSAAVGDKTLTFTAQGSAAENFYAEGWVSVTLAVNVDALGQVFKVKSHPIFAIAEKVVTLDDDQPVRAILAVGDELAFSPSPFDECIIVPINTPTSIITGVAHAAIDGDQYGWLQTRGVCAMKSAAAGVVAENVEAIMVTAGVGADTATTNIDEHVGVFMTISDQASECATVMLKLE